MILRNLVAVAAADEAEEWFSHPIVYSKREIELAPFLFFL